MDVTPVRHTDFPTRLKEILSKAGDKYVYVCLRVDGEPTDSNIVIRSTAFEGRVCWRVGTHGGRRRLDTWNLAGMIEKVSTQGFPSDVQATYERGINQIRAGWVALQMQRGRVIGAKVISTLESLGRP